MKGSVWIGGESPVSIQSMTKSPTTDISATIAELEKCIDAGVDIMRISVPDEKSARAFAEIIRIIKPTGLPIVADIHFSPKLAFLSLDAGADCVRINPGNINNEEIVHEIIEKTRDLGRSMRIGVNSGSIVPREGMSVKDYNREINELMVAEAVRFAEFAESLNFTNFVVSLKSSDVLQTIEVNRTAAKLLGKIPMHLGVTHAGVSEHAKRKSAVGIGTLLAEGIGDTIRVSIAGTSESEVYFARELLADLQLRKRELDVIVCPACARTVVDVEKLGLEVERRLTELKIKTVVSILGCAVNGPGEAAESDFGIVAGKTRSWIYKNKDRVLEVANTDLVEKFISYIVSEQSSV
ncbi:MAG: flavodoxin-dependent (E)-4-hydroxy-3-methylbut-2-enyl-diphosphate synthase [Planctomycetes bacterium]|nr:flavodoxin-dependent (E)-4-hydroxy-3-methylbut-2-enyl-diphosphate synthase [Planctomycetota bacterium]